MMNTILYIGVYFKSHKDQNSQRVIERIIE